MKKRIRKRIFSIIFVPDQERDPRSISMSYAKGRFLAAVGILLCIHLLMGFFGYYQIIHLGKKKHQLQVENLELKDQNKKIERIAREFQEIRNADEKIRKAFGGSLGLYGQGSDVLDQIPLSASGSNGSTRIGDIENRPFVGDTKQLQNRLYFLIEESGDYFNPECVPTFLPVEGFLTTHFQRGGWFVGRSHLGIDIAARRGSTIRAAGAGIVVLANWTQGFGNVVIISHGNGLNSYYAHAMRLLVEQGDNVRKGQPIALLGSSGISSAPHLHFEIWKNGEPLDPEQFIFALQQRKEGDD
jgi:murein DD-endopeptidase MepM/ murein hydrolase activator NlpD